MSRFAYTGPWSRFSKRNHQRGYVLLFVLGLLAVVATLILSIAVTLRLDGQLLGQEKTALQEEYLLRGAARYAAIQLSITAAVDALKLPESDDALRKWVLWRPTGQAYEASLGGTRVMATLEDVSGLPDANLLSAQEWERILMLTGAASPSYAKSLATKIVDLREQLVRTRGTLGFSTLSELLEWDEIPSSMVNGGTEMAPLGIKDLVVVGTRNRRVNLNSTPLPLLSALGNVTNEQLQRLAALRKMGSLPAVQAQQWLQGTGLVAHSTDAFPSAVRARLRLASAPPGTATVVAFITSENGSFAVVDQMQDRGTIGR